MVWLMGKRKMSVLEARLFAVRKSLIWKIVLVNAEIVWSNGRKSEGKSAYHEMGIRFTKLSGNDRTFLNGVISNHT
jgi:hypothetical protein